MKFFKAEKKTNINYEILFRDVGMNGDVLAR